MVYVVVKKVRMIIVITITNVTVTSVLGDFFQAVTNVINLKSATNSNNLNTFNKLKQDSYLLLKSLK